MNDRMRQTLITQVKPFLQGDESVKHIFQAARGENAWIAGWSTIVRFPRLIVITERAVLLLSTKSLGRPDGVLARLARSTPLGPPESNIWTTMFPPLWGRQAIRINGERLWANTSAAELHAIDATGVSDGVL